MTEAEPPRSGDSLKDILQVLRRASPVILVFVFVFGIGAAVASVLQTPEYRASAALYVSSGADSNSQTAYQGALASQQRVASYVTLVRSQQVVAEALAGAKIPLSAAEATSALSATSTPDTVLLTVSATTGSRSVSTALANAASRALVSYVRQIETPAGGGSPLAKLTIVNDATSSGKPVSPKYERNIALGLLVGLVIGCAVVLIWRRFSSRIRTESDLAQVSGLPVLAGIPSDDLLRNRGLINFKEGGGAAAEAFRKLRTNLTFSNVDHPPRVVIVSSAVAVEGKTTTALNLAASLVEDGNRVVLVDADLRRPQVDARTGLIGEVGLTNLLRADGDLNEMVQPTQVDGLWVLASGPRPPNPAELLGAKRAGQALAELSQSFDFVVVDSPPILPVTDAVVLSQWVDGIILVARSGSTRAGDFADAIEQVSTSQTPVIGFVLTEAPVNRNRYGYYAVASQSTRGGFGRRRQPKAIEQVLEPKSTGRH